jgi:hypothetical protein
LVLQVLLVLQGNLVFRVAHLFLLVHLVHPVLQGLQARPVHQVFPVDLQFHRVHLVLLVPLALLVIRVVLAYLVLQVRLVFLVFQVALGLRGRLVLLVHRALQDIQAGRVDLLFLLGHSALPVPLVLRVLLVYRVVRAFQADHLGHLVLRDLLEHLVFLVFPVFLVVLVFLVFHLVLQALQDPLETPVFLVGLVFPVYLVVLSLLRLQSLLLLWDLLDSPGALFLLDRNRSLSGNTTGSME